MKLKVDKSLVPIKAHFFFFFAALGPLLPQMNVFGRQLGVSPGAMGLVTSVLPLLWAAAKPLFGYVVDYWPRHRKLVFMLLIATMTGSYCCLWFLPMPDPPPQITQNVYALNDTVYLKKVDNTTIDELLLQKYSCQWTCANDTFDVYLSNSTYINTVFVDSDVANTSCSLFNMDFNDEREGEIICVPKTGCNLICLDKELNGTEVNVQNGTHLENALSMDGTDNLYMTSVFWAFVVLMCVGTVAFNVANCIGDAVCFDVLGTERASKYGAQRAWGTAGYGLTALLGGALIDLTSGAYKDFTPAFVIALAATAVDLYSCRRLNLPSLTSPDDSGKALRDVLRIPRVLVFIVFAVVAGTFDSFIIYYMFWFLEELAEETGSMAKIKLIEGVVVAAQSFIGELLFFYFSGKIIKRWGYGATLTLSLFCYALRLALISFIQHPWHLVFIESIMQGPTYALCYSCIVGYAAFVAPEGYSATVQGVVAGMDDGVGFALGSLVGGQLYAWAGGRGSFRVMAAVAAVAATAHLLMYRCVTRDQEQKAEQSTPEGEKMLEIDSSAIYRPTVVPLSEKGDNR
ncbi:major facilitator superfamily domain-containing protein 6 [Leguminivora glycinivorella]|uniref:major facilitator superfamily domain-containing protein 6 n=1 Tax=Leguminivora glycinivorella TaxID=1035111 RepID=UPI00200BD892|nr:major facilitator superfamily domain-containing protein 6 [Leguminivora glycinivorella]